MDRAGKLLAASDSCRDQSTPGCMSSIAQTLRESPDASRSSIGNFYCPTSCPTAFRRSCCNNDASIVCFNSRHSTYDYSVLVMGYPVVACSEALAIIKERPSISARIITLLSSPCLQVAWLASVQDLIPCATAFPSDSGRVPTACCCCQETLRTMLASLRVSSLAVGHI